MAQRSKVFLWRLYYSLVVSKNPQTSYGTKGTGIFTQSQISELELNLRLLNPTSFALLTLHLSVRYRSERKNLGSQTDRNLMSHLTELLLNNMKLLLGCYCLSIKQTRWVNAHRCCAEMAPDQAFRKQQSRFLHAGHTLLSKQACVAEEGPHSKSEMYELSARALPAEATQTMSPYSFKWWDSIIP